MNKTNARRNLMTMTGWPRDVGLRGFFGIYRMPLAAARGVHTLLSFVLYL